LRQLEKITVIGLGLLGGSVALAARRSFSAARVVGYTHRASTRRKARRLGVADEVVDGLDAAVDSADLVVLASPISSFEGLFSQMGQYLRDGCIVTDVGSTKVLPHRWAKARLPKRVFYVGSHPIAGSEQRGVEYARDDLFYQAVCVVTRTKDSDEEAVRTLLDFWSALGCCVKVMQPGEHDRLFGNVSHLPHALAVALVNATRSEQLRYAGKGFLDTSRIAAGPENIWADIFLTNASNVSRGIERVIRELTRLQRAISRGDRGQIERLLHAARQKRSGLVRYKLRRKELIE